MFEDEAKERAQKGEKGDQVGHSISDLTPQHEQCFPFFYLILIKTFGLERRNEAHLLVMSCRCHFCALQR